MLLWSMFLFVGNGEARDGIPVTPIILFVHEPASASDYHLMLPAFVLADLVTSELVTCS